MPRVPQRFQSNLSGGLSGNSIRGVEIISEIVVKSRGSPYNSGILSPELLEHGNGISLCEAALWISSPSLLVAAVQLADARQPSLL